MTTRIIVGACDRETEGFIRELCKSKRLADNRLQIVVQNEITQDSVVGEYWELLHMDKYDNYVAQHKILQIFGFGRLDELLDKAIAIEEALQ